MTAIQPTRVSRQGLGTFFAAADEPVAGIVGKRGFETSLVHNFLFGRTLIVHEAYLFNSTLLVDHVGACAGGESLFEVAAAEGILRPAYRSAGVSSAGEALEYMRELYTPGDLPLVAGAELSSEHRRIVMAVDAGNDSGPPVRATARSFGEGYERAMKEYFLSDEVPVDASRKEWAAVREWSLLIHEACERTAARGNQGLQRSELVRSICRQLGVPMAYLPLEELLPLCGHPERKRALTLFWLRMNQIHWMNNSQVLGCASTVPAVDVAGRPAAHGGPETLSQEFSHEVEVPSSRALASLPARCLRDARRGAGEHYRQALAHPTAGPREIRDALDAYGRELRRLVRDSSPSLLRYAPAATKTMGIVGGLGAVAKAAAVLVSAEAAAQTGVAVDLGLGAITLVGTGVYIAERVHTRPATHRVEFLVEPPSEF